MTLHSPNSFLERQYFNEIPPSPQAAIAASWTVARAEQRDDERDHAHARLLILYNAAPGNHEDKMEAVFGAVTDLRFDLHEDVYVIVDSEYREVRVAA
jgi:hypothetical protein